MRSWTTIPTRHVVHDDVRDAAAEVEAARRDVGAHQNPRRRHLRRLLIRRHLLLSHTASAAAEAAATTATTATAATAATASIQLDARGTAATAVRCGRGGEGGECGVALLRRQLAVQRRRADPRQPRTQQRVHAPHAPRA